MYGKNYGMVKVRHFSYLDRASPLVDLTFRKLQQDSKEIGNRQA